MLKRDHITSRLILGTAQLGMDYGIANRTGQPDIRSAKSIVGAAISGGIRMFDTAQAYGESEKTLSSVLRDLGCLKDVSIFTKLAPTVNGAAFDSVRDAVEKSSLLFGPAFYCCMLHSEEQLDQWSRGLGEWLRFSRDRGLFQHIGVSVYDPPAARRALETEGIDFVQLPANVLDRRHERAGVMRLAKDLGKSVIIRSVFLQGALLLPSGSLPESVIHLKPYLEPFAGVAFRNNISSRDASLLFVREQWPECLVTFGAELPEQITDNVSSWSMDLPDKVFTELLSVAAGVPLEAVRPDLWGAGRKMITGSRLCLRLMKPSDAWGRYLDWMNDPGVTRFLESRFRSYTSADLEDYILANIRNSEVRFMAIEERDSGNHIGNIKVGPLNTFHRTAEIGLIIGDRMSWGKGYATEAIGLAAEIAFQELDVRKLIAGCYRENGASERAFIKNGFHREGLLQKHVVDEGRISDVVLLGLHREGTCSPLWGVR